MKIIADSSASRTEWALVDGATVVEHAFTKGLNPFFHTRRDISHSIRLELPEAFFKRRWERIHFYGAGCTSPEKKKIVEALLVAQFKTPVTVESDLLGAAAAADQRGGHSLYSRQRLQLVLLRRPRDSEECALARLYSWRRGQRRVYRQAISQRLPEGHCSCAACQRLFRVYQSVARRDNVGNLRPFASEQHVECLFPILNGQARPGLRLSSCAPCH